MAEDVQRAQDAEWHKKSYETIMKWSAEVGVPFCLALAMFFTNLVMANGVGVAFVAGVLTHLAAFWVVRTFFTH